MFRAKRQPVSKVTSVHATKNSTTRNTEETLKLHMIHIANLCTLNAALPGEPFESACFPLSLVYRSYIHQRMLWSYTSDITNPFLTLHAIHLVSSFGFYHKLSFLTLDISSQRRGQLRQ